MLKHSLSPAPQPPLKRMRLVARNDTHGTLTASLSDEVMMHIFSYLSAKDLCVVQSCSRNWARLAADSHLWKSLYFQEYGRRRLRGAASFINRMDGRSVRPLPGRAKLEHSEDDVMQWKWMFRTSTNWKTGRCLVEHTEYSDPSQHHILLAGPLILTASSQESLVPEFTLRSPSGASRTLECESTHRRNGVYRITMLALDQSSSLPSPRNSNPFRLASFLSTGEFVVFSGSHADLSACHRVLTYVPTFQNSRTGPIIRAAYRHPILVTLSQAFSLSIYDLSDDTVKHTQTLTSFTSLPPSSLILSAPNANSSAYKLVLTYAIQVYPSHFSVGATELMISTSGIGGPALEVVSTRTTRTIDIPQGWIDEKKLRLMRDQWHRKVEGVAACATDGKWVVLASTPSTAGETAASSTEGRSRKHLVGQTNTALQLYRLSLPAIIPPTLSGLHFTASPPQPKLTFVRCLEGPPASISVCSLALADSRCVSLGHDGSIWVWDLEGGAGVEVSKGNDATKLGDGEIVFDDKRIICTGNGAVTVRRFDMFVLFLFLAHYEYSNLHVLRYLRAGHKSLASHWSTQLGQLVEAYHRRRVAAVRH